MWQLVECPIILFAESVMTMHIMSLMLKCESKYPSINEPPLLKKNMAVKDKTESADSLSLPTLFHFLGHGYMIPKSTE